MKPEEEKATPEIRGKFLFDVEIVWSRHSGGSDILTIKKVILDALGVKKSQTEKHPFHPQLYEDEQGIFLVIRRVPKGEITNDQ